MPAPGAPPAHEPLAVVASHWYGNPDFASAYSYLRPGGRPDDRDLLARPLAPGLHLAGEATWSAHPGTMHGAWWSGERAARQVIEDTGADDTAARGARAPVVVIGAGLAGLAAARLLASAGRRAVVLEAGTRPGGRACTDRSLGVPAHLGASWIHGDQGNPVAELARRLRVPTTPTRPTRRTTVVVGRGVLAGPDLARLEAARARVEPAVEAAAQAADADEALGPVLRRVVAEAAPDEDDRLVLWSWVRSDYEGLYSAPVDDLSLVHGDEPYLLPGDNLTVVGPLDRLVAALAEGLDLRFGTRATAVEAVEAAAVEAVEAAAAAPGGDDGARWLVTTEPASGRGRGARLAARSVVVAVPLGALAAGRPRFAPPLAAPVPAAIERIGPGQVAKVVATFREPFWAPHRAFSVVTAPAAVLPRWYDVSEVAGVPALAAFGTGDDVSRLEAATPQELRRLVSDILRPAQLALATPGPTSAPSRASTAGPPGTTGGG